MSGYRHEALLYAGHDEFMAGVLGFVEGAVDADEPILVVLDANKIADLQGALSTRGDRVQFADMAAVGKNPARIIPAWQRFVAEHGGPGVRLRGIGEPIWAGRSAPALAECHRHEALLNLAFDDPDFWLLCPYDTESLPAAVIDEAARNHPFVADGAGASASATFAGVDSFARPLSEPLGAVPARAWMSSFGRDDLRRVRDVVAEFARAQCALPERAADLALAVHEVAVNALVHGDSGGTIALWRDGQSLVAEVGSAGAIRDDALFDRTIPLAGNADGRGLWMANQLCDLVQVRSFPGEVVVRLYLDVD